MNESDLEHTKLSEIVAVVVRGVKIYLISETEISFGREDIEEEGGVKEMWREREGRGEKGM